MQEDLERQQKLDEVKRNRMDSILQFAEKKKEKQGKVEEFKRRMQTEEATRIKENLEIYDQKLSKTNARNRECLTNRVESVRRRNQSLSEKLSMFRTSE